MNDELKDESRRDFQFSVQRSAFIAYFQSVVTPLDARGQKRGVARVFDVVRDVREEGAARLQLFDVSKRAFEREVRRVWANAQTVEHENV